MTEYKDLEKQIGIKFQDYDMFKKAFTHKSYINEHRDEGFHDNERLEFLGDAVLELAATRYLFNTLPDKNEGDLTSFRSALVRGRHLADVAKELDLGKYLYLSKGEERSGGREKDYILANTVESLIGAIYLDLGIETADEFIDKFILVKLENIIEQGLHIDAKSHFQEICQEEIGITPHYGLMKDEGPDHDKKFVIGAYIGEELIAEGEGSSKQKAEDAAARNALKVKGWMEHTTKNPAV